MGLGGTLANALSGLQVTQAGLDVVSRNVANSSTAGYSKQTLSQSVADYGGPTFGVKVGEVERVLNQHLLDQLRGELTGAGYSSTMQSYLERLEMSFGAPGAGNGLESLYGNFESSLEKLITSPESPSARAEFTQNASLLASSLNSLTSDVQELRRQAETEIDSSVNRINELLEGIASANRKIAISPVDDPMVLDQRDQLISELSGLMEVNVMPPAQDGTVSVLSRSGTLMASDVAMKLTFENRQATVTPHSLYEDGGLGTIMLSGPGRPPVDLIQEGAFTHSGKIGALLELRDETLVEAQNSLDTLADSLARSMSTEQISSSEVVVAGEVQSRTLDFSAKNLQDGDSFSFSYKDGTTTRTFTFVSTTGVSGALPDGATGADDTVVAIDFSQGDAAIGADILAALPPSVSAGLSVTVTGGRSGTIQFTDTAAGSGATITGLTGTSTATSVSGQVAVPLFTDGGSAYTGSYNSGSQQRGFAGSIRVNQAILDDTTLLSVHDAGIPLGDPTRAQDMLQRLQSAEVRTPNGDIMASSATSNVRIGTMVSRVISTQAARASAANQRSDAQGQVVTQLEERIARASGVSIDEEMTKLLSLQMAYQANAKVVQTYEEMVNRLMEIR